MLFLSKSTTNKNYKNNNFNQEVSQENSFFTVMFEKIPSVPIFYIVLNKTSNNLSLNLLSSMTPNSLSNKY